MAVETMVVFRVHGESFALPGETVSEVMPFVRLSTPAGLPDALAGLLDVGGKVVAVLNTAGVLGMPQGSNGLYSHLLHLRRAEPDLALAVDRVTAVRGVHQQALSAVPESETFRGCIVGQIEGPEGPIHVLSLDRLLNEAEQRRIEAFKAEEERRRAMLEGQER